MNDLKNRLSGCFGAVFPGRSAEELMRADRETMQEWDSLASITLLTVVQEEFQVTIDLFDLEKFGSFSALLEYLAEQSSERSQ
jgi:acyl carrier protein